MPLSTPGAVAPLTIIGQPTGNASPIATGSGGPVIQPLSGSSAPIISGFLGQLTGVGQFDNVIQRPDIYPCCTITLVVQGTTPSVNVQVVDNVNAGVTGWSAVDNNGSQSGITGNFSFTVVGLRNWVGLRVTSASGTGLVISAYITFHGATAGAATGGTSIVTQGNKGSAGQGWYVAITDFTNTVAIDNSRALATSNYAQGSTTPGDTAVRIATTRVNIAAQAITAGTPVTVFTPTAGKKFRVLGYSLSSDSALAGVIFKNNHSSVDTELFRTPVTNPGSPINSPAGGLTNGKPGTNASDALDLDVTATTTVSGWIDLMQE